MEHAYCGDELLVAIEVAKDYTQEKEIRKASGHKLLRCPDPECEAPIVRYCHGEKREAFFAHLNNANCDYATFDRGNTPITRTIKRMIYEHFKAQGYKVELEVKVLDHHYTHLLFKMDDSCLLALELGTSRLSANQMDSLSKDYAEKHIAVKWLVIGHTNANLRESQTFFLKRYLLNESKNKDLLVISYDGLEIAQYKIDPHEYRFEGRKMLVKGYDETYVEYGHRDTLTIVDQELTLSGFKERYLSWLEKKQAAFENQKEQRVAEETLQQEKLIRSLQRQIKPHQTLSTPVSKTSDDAHYREEILPYISQQKEPVFDSLGRRWIVCESCGAIETTDHFVSYGGKDHINLGICKDCS